MKRRDFLKNTVAVSTLGGLGATSLAAFAAPASSPGREYYELRAYQLKPSASRALLDSYLEKAAIPAWNRLGIKPVGVFVQAERPTPPAATEAVDASLVFVLLPYPSLEAFATVADRLNADAQYQKDGADYLQSPKTSPAFQRIDSWLMQAFAGMPKLEQPAYSRDKTPRLFEMRTYESHSELKALKKVEMFNAGEIQTMREVGLGPIFYGQALVGSSLPHLTYMLSAETQEAHKAHWAAFLKHPVWNRLKNDPLYADTVSKITNRFLTPAPCSQI